jgi:hypothetical protein
MYDAVRTQVQSWLDRGIVGPAPAGCLWNSPLLAVPKKDADGKFSKVRVCLDPRALNAILANGDNFEVPKVDDLIESLAGAAVFSTLDLKDSYHQFPIHPDHCAKTAFTFAGRQYMFLRTPFGLRHITSVFQRVMSIVLQNLHFALSYVDDIVIFSNSIELHSLHVVEVVDRLTTAGLILNPDKCCFGKLRITLLGRVISRHGIALDPTKISDIANVPEPKTGKQIQRFLGMVNFLRRHIPYCASVCAPLDKLRGAKFIELDAEARRSFVNIKRILQAAPVLSFPDFQLHFFVATDASTTGIAAMLFQEPKPGDRRYIAFIARALRDAERNYSATKLELLAIVFALERLRYYLWGRHFTLYTDHKPLSFLFSQRTTNRMMETWFDILMEFRFDIIHLPGLQNFLPDALSRLFQPSCTTTCPAPAVTPTCAFASSKPAGSDLTNIADDMEHRAQLLEAAHLFGHFGIQTMMDRIHQQGFTWPTLRQDCRKVVDACIPCQRYNVERHGFHPLQSINALMPWDHIAIDLAGPFPTSPRGNNYLLVIVDVATRFVFLRCLRDKCAESVAQALFALFCDAGWPKVMQSDNGLEFVNQLVEKLCNNAGIDKRLTSPYHPRANGLAERFVQTTTNVVKKQLNGKLTDWDLHVPTAQLAVNTKAMAIHGSVPFSLFYARQFAGFQDFRHDDMTKDQHDFLLKRLDTMTKLVFPTLEGRKSKHASRTQQSFNAKHKLEDFPEGAYVMTIDSTRSSKLDPVYEGPFRVLRRTKGGSYELIDTDGALIKRRFPPSQLKLIRDPSPKPTHDVYVVEDIIDDRLNAEDKREYLVKWKGFSDRDNTWEPRENFIDLDVIKRYERGKAESQQPQPRPPLTDAEQGRRRHHARTQQQARRTSPEEHKDNRRPMRVTRSSEKLGGHVRQN